MTSDPPVRSWILVENGTWLNLATAGCIETNKPGERAIWHPGDTADLRVLTRDPDVIRRIDAYLEAHQYLG